jgi:hypothetical protein
MAAFPHARAPELVRPRALVFVRVIERWQIQQTSVTIVIGRCQALAISVLDRRADGIDPPGELWRIVVRTGGEPHVACSIGMPRPHAQAGE